MRTIALGLVPLLLRDLAPPPAAFTARPPRRGSVGLEILVVGLVGVSIEGHPLPSGPPIPDDGAKVAAHEIGHLLGAHHHSVSAAPVPRRTTPPIPAT